jgi:hypothetical protein
MVVAAPRRCSALPFAFDTIGTNLVPVLGTRHFYITGWVFGSSHDICPGTDTTTSRGAVLGHLLP